MWRIHEDSKELDFSLLPVSRTTTSLKWTTKIQAV